MAAPVWDLASGVKNCAKDIGDFLYEKGSPRSKKIEHSHEELEQKLEQTRTALFELYDEIARAQG